MPTSPQPLHETKLVLASTSATRRQILRNAGLEFTVDSPAVDENVLKSTWGERPVTGIAEGLAIAKSLSLAGKYPSRIVIGADQTLIFENRVLSKSLNLEEARAMLSTMRGKTHILQSALACTCDGQKLWTHVAEAKLTMRHFSDTFLDHYIDHAGPAILDSVGSYKLEETGIHLFEKIQGDHYTILGLPLLPLLAFLRQHEAIPA